MKIFSFLSAPILAIGFAGFTSTSMANTESDRAQPHPQPIEATANTSRQHRQWQVRFRGKPPFKRTQVTTDPRDEQPQFAAVSATSHNRVQIGPRGKNRVITRYRSTAEEASESAQFARFEEASDTAEPPKRCQRRGAPGKSMPTQPRRC